MSRTKKPIAVDTTENNNPCREVFDSLPRVVDLRGTPCEEFFAEALAAVRAAQLDGAGVGLRLTRGQSLYLALGTFGTDPVLGNYTVTPDFTGCDFELRCDARPEVVAAYMPDWTRFMPQPAGHRRPAEIKPS